MEQTLFEGKKKIRKVVKEAKQFEEIVDKFGFKEEIDLVSFCTSIALNLYFFNNNIELYEVPKLKEVTNMYSFNKAELYDLVIYNYLEKETNRLQEFEKFFYTGFKQLTTWNQDYGDNYGSEISRVNAFLEYLNKKK